MKGGRLGKQLKVGCNSQYPCHNWNCSTCSTKKLFWLREQALNFARLLANQETYFTTIKGLDAIQIALDRLRSYTPIKNANRPRYNAKKEYFFVIAKHGYSEWHIHIISNFALDIEGSHVEKVRSRKDVCLYLVKNLEMSRSQDYGSMRRYGGSSLLNKQNFKKWYIIRIRLFKLRTRFRLALVFAAMVAMASALRYTVDRDADSDVCSDTVKSQDEYRPQTTRPPPKPMLD